MASEGMQRATGSSHRYAAIDLMRGIVMVLMVLDHGRDFLGASNMNPRDVSDALLFLTRWITHFCAPVFAFLAGVSAWFATRKMTRTRDATRYLALRGLWLIVLELTIVRFGWTFSLWPDFILLQVLWALGCGMIVLSLLLALSPAIVGLCGVLIIVFHNLLDFIQAKNLGSFAWLWHLLHEPQLFQHASGLQIWALYAIIPWLGVMAFGFGFAPNLIPGKRKNRFFYLWGGGMLGLFMLLRLTGVYGDPQPWQPQATVLASVLAFVNCEKYPPSLQFLLMTLGPMLALYPWLNRLRGRAARVLLTFGEVPMFFYLLHIPLLHALAVLLEAAHHHPLVWLFGNFPPMAKPVGYGMPLPAIYGFWIVSLFVLYWPCRMYGLSKAQHRRWWHQLI